MQTQSMERLEQFGAETTADQVLEGIDLTGKSVLITGGTSGLGEESARAMAAKGAQVTITVRNMEKAEQVAARILAETESKIEVEELELASFASIRAFAKRILEREETIDILILNAGVMACPHSKTADGYELQFGTNHLGHFLLTCLIASKISDGGRIVSLSSSGHQFSPVVFEDLQFEKREYHRWAAYGQSKTANALFAVGLNDRLASRNIEAFSLHPGAILTELGRHLTEEDVAMYQERVENGTLPIKSIPAGAATQVLAATAPELAGRGGSFLADCHICPIDDEADSFTVVRSYAVDPDTADRLWRVSEEMVGETLNL